MNSNHIDINMYISISAEINNGTILSSQAREKHSYENTKGTTMGVQIDNPWRRHVGVQWSSTLPWGYPCGLFCTNQTNQKRKGLWVVGMGP